MHLVLCHDVASGRHEHYLFEGAMENARHCYCVLVG